MDRKKFLRKSFCGIGTIIAIPPLLSSCVKGNSSKNGESVYQEISLDACTVTPREVKGPFPNLTPSELARQNIISDRKGVAFLINITIQDQRNNCLPLKGVLVDIWHCDAAGNYSQYVNTYLQRTDYSDKEFLRGRQTTDNQGKVSFISIFPGWYAGRAPHVHIEVLDGEEKSLHVTQLAFPQEVCEIVYATEGYRGTADTLNEKDIFFRDGVAGNLIDITGNLRDGYVMEKVVII